jgi:hypothetical protein
MLGSVSKPIMFMYSLKGSKYGNGNAYVEGKENMKVETITK